MGKLDSFAETSPIKNGPATEDQDAFGGGLVQASFTESMPLKRTPNMMGVFSDQSMGTVEASFTGTVPLKRQAHRGYESGTPINAQDENPGA